ncbi:MAG: DNA methyltransferase, partial [FCB group bacterium]|nr:DNA methyltransferase [FCB group bacterium]
MSNTIVGVNAIDTAGQFGSGPLLPLYLYPDPDSNGLFDEEERTDAPGGRRPNLSPEFIEEFSGKLKLEFIPDGKGDLEKDFGPEDVFNYIYAVFHAPTYRERYAEFLKIDFPRVPLTSNRDLFRELCGLGERLVKLHLVEEHSDRLPDFPIEGDCEVDKVRYTEPGQGADAGRVWINQTQYFAGGPPEGWEF